MSKSSYFYHLVNSSDPEVECDVQDLLAKEESYEVTLTPGVVTIAKNEKNMLGIALSGGAPYCPCIYLIKIERNLPVQLNGTLEVGDEIVAINDICIKGRTSHDVTKLILQTRDQVKFKYNKLHLPDKQPNSIAVAYQKIKYRILESIKLDDSENVYRHLIIEDKGWRKKINRINCLEQMYRQLLYSIKHVVKAHVDICQIYKVFGDVLGEIAAKETQQGASEALARFADNHRQAKNFGVRMIKRMKPILNDVSTFYDKVIPDAKLTLRKYSQAKLEWISYYAEANSLLNEEYESKEFDFPLRRLETGNYYLRIILRYAEISKSQFEKTCADLKIKLELLEAKNDQEIVRHLQRIMGEWMTFHRSVAHTQSARKMFPFEMDLGKATASLQKEAPKPLDPLLVYRDEDDDDEDDEDANVTNECGGDGSNKTNHDSVQHPNAKPKIVERYSDALTALDGSMMHSTDVVPSKEEQEKFRRLQMTSAESNRSTEQTSNFFDISLENNEPQIEVEKDLWSFE